MKYVAAYLLATLGGKKNPDSATIESILSSVGIDVDKERLNLLLSELNGKNIEEVIAAGQLKLQSVPSGGAVVASKATSATSSATSGKQAASTESVPEESKKKEVVEEKSDEDMGLGLFD